MSGSYTVASKVAMVNGQLTKDDYRRYKIENLGQLNVAARVISEKGLLGKINLLAIAMEKGDKYKRIYRAGFKIYIKLEETSKESRLLILLCDEAHRFANDSRERLNRKENI